MTMNLPAVVAVVTMMTIGSGGAAAETWCMRQIDGGARACVFSSGQDCARAAGMSAAGGICEREGAASSVAKPEDRRSRGQGVRANER